MTRRAPPPELAQLIQRVARHPHGLGFLHRAYIDSVAITLGVHPFVVDAARAYLETPGGRAELIESVRREHESDRVEAAENEARCPSCIDEVETLIQAAAKHPRGMEQLGADPAEQVAESFHVHPYLVFRARGVLERRRLFTHARS